MIQCLGCGCCRIPQSPLNCLLEFLYAWVVSSVCVVQVFDRIVGILLHGGSGEVEVSNDPDAGNECVMCHLLPGSKGGGLLKHTLRGGIRAHDTDHDEVNLGIAGAGVVGAWVSHVPGIKYNQVIKLNKPS